MSDTLLVILSGRFVIEQLPSISRAEASSWRSQIYRQSRSGNRSDMVASNTISRTSTSWKEERSSHDTISGSNVSMREKAVEYQHK